MLGIFLQHTSATLFPWVGQESEEPIEECTGFEKRGKNASEEFDIELMLCIF